MIQLRIEVQQLHNQSPEETRQDIDYWLNELKDYEILSVTVTMEDD